MEEVAMSQKEICLKGLLTLLLIYTLMALDKITGTTPIDIKIKEEAASGALASGKKCTFDRELERQIER